MSPNPWFHTHTAARKILQELARLLLPKANAQLALVCSAARG